MIRMEMGFDNELNGNMGFCNEMTVITEQRHARINDHPGAGAGCSWIIEHVRKTALIPKLLEADHMYDLTPNQLHLPPLALPWQNPTKTIIYMISTVHVPIMVEPILDALIAPFRQLPESAPPHYIVDCTLGGGGHTAAFLEAFASDPKLQKHRLLAIDQDPAAIARTKERFAQELASGRLAIIQGPFGDLAELLGTEERPVLGILADLGFSSDQLDDAERGLSFQSEGPLDMRLNPTQGVSCRDFLTRITEQQLVKILSEYGEERFSNRIAKAIIDVRRKTGVPKTTRDLAELIVRTVPPPARHGRIHAATRTFQALRIAVNGELEQLDSLLEHVIVKLQPGGRVAVLSFHSLEDRKVKLAFRGQAFKVLTKKPLEADDAELRRNPRARSAKLRIAERVG